MKIVYSFLLLIAFLFTACLLSGCATGSSKPDRCGYYSDAYSLYLSTTTLRPVSKEESSSAAAAAIFLRTYCGWTGPKGSPFDVDENGVPIVFPPAPASSRSASLGLRDPLAAIGPPSPGRKVGLPLGWDHNPAADGTTEYRLYWGRGPSGWDGVISTPASSGQRYRWETSQAGPARFVVTAVRPPKTAEGETDPQESDPSNELAVTVSGYPIPPGKLRSQP